MMLITIKREHSLNFFFFNFREKSEKRKRKKVQKRNRFGSQRIGHRDMKMQLPDELYYIRANDFL